MHKLCNWNARVMCSAIFLCSVLFTVIVAVITITPSNLYIAPNDDSGDSTFDCDSSKEFHWIVNGSTVSKDDIKHHSEVQVIQKHILWVKHCINNTQYGCGYNTTSEFFNATGTVYCKGLFQHYMVVLYSRLHFLVM